MENKGSQAVNTSEVLIPIRRPVLVACNEHQAQQIFSQIKNTAFKLPIVCALPPRSCWAYTLEEAMEFFAGGIQLNLGDK